MERDLWNIRLLTSFTAAVLLSACASDPVPPTAELQSAESALDRAQEAGAAQVAGPEMRSAIEHLTAAKVKAAGDKEDDMVAARRLAQKSEADSELALAKSEEAKAQAVNQQIKEGIEALRAESQRKMEQ